MFTQKTIEKISHYVYGLKSDSGYFYIGRGQGNRAFAHAKDSLKVEHKSDKLKEIRAILLKGEEVEIDIIRHNLTEKEAVLIEAALIDAIGLKDLTNMKRGDNKESGIISAAELELEHNAEELNSSRKLLLLIINKSYDYRMNENQIYECVRRSWAVKVERAVKAEFVLAVAHGLIRGVYKAKEWYELSEDEIQDISEKGKKAFNGYPVQSELLGASVRHLGHMRKGFKYINIS